MPFHLHIHRHKDADGGLSPKSPKSPRSPGQKSPSLSRTDKNPDFLNQCAGCSNVEKLIRRNIEHQKSGLEKLPNALLHNDFDELDKCARKCEICRVFRQALVLEQVTFDGVNDFQQRLGEVVVRWQESGAAGGTSRVSLNVELNGQAVRRGVIHCSSHDDIGHLELASHVDAVVIEQIQGWLDTCLKSHIGQCDNLRWSSENPRRLVKILSPTGPLQLCEDQKCEYVALSYCWGDVQKLPRGEHEEVERGKTILANLDQRYQSFPISDLPATVRDALHIIYAIGYRYAWVDTLCIVQDKPEDVSTMHKVYSNALFTLCACATTKATARLLDQREAWIYKTEPCRLGGQWLTTSDMSLNELRFRSPLADRAWTLQEERLSPRMLYVASNRVYWSCAGSHEMEMKPVYVGRKATPLQRPAYAASDRDSQMPFAQEFLKACRSGTNDLHAYWADIVRSYALRSMSHIEDRLTALSGLAAKYLSASKGDEYLAGIWAKHLAEGLAWRVNRAIESNRNDLGPMILSPPWPSWSWAALPLETAIETNAKSESSPYFRIVAHDGVQKAEHDTDADDGVRRGEQVKEIHVTGRTRRFWQPSSRRSDWSTVSKVVDGEEKFTFASNPEVDRHAAHPESGCILVYEDRKREVLGQLDYRRDVERFQLDQVDTWTLEIGRSTMLLLEHCGEGRWCRIGVAWDVREDYFASTQSATLILR